MKKKEFYILATALMAGSTFICLVVTLIFQFFAKSAFQTVLTQILLAVFLILTLVCLCIYHINGNNIYKIGFYLLHLGLSVLLVGFILSSFTTKSYTVNIYKDGKYYDTVKDGDKTAKLGFFMRLDGCDTEYYDDKTSVKQYYAYLTVNKDGDVHTDTLSVNNPVYENGYKIYLMEMSKDGETATTLLIKRDPAEYTIYTGIAMLIIGTFVICFAGGKKKKTVAKETDV